MQRETRIGWADRSAHETCNGTWPHIVITKTNRRERNLYNNLYRLQHVYKRIQDDTVHELDFEIVHFSLWTNVQLNEDRKVE